MNCQRTFLFASGTDSIINFIYIKEKPLCTRLLSELLLVRHEENELQSNLYISFVFIDYVRGGLNVWVMWRTFTLFIVLIYTLLDLSFVLSCLWEFPLLLLRVSFPSLVSIFICFKYSNSRNNKAFNLVQHNTEEKKVWGFRILDRYILYLFLIFVVELKKIKRSTFRIMDEKCIWISADNKSLLEYKEL